MRFVVLNIARNTFSPMLFSNVCPKHSCSDSPTVSFGSDAFATKFRAALM